MPDKIFDRLRVRDVNDANHALSPIPTVARLRVCERIEPDRQLNGKIFEASLADRWGRLTRPLLLAGASAMKESPSGEFPTLMTLAEGMPWAETVVAHIERELRTALALGRPWIRLEPMLFLGPPGIGKTWIARRLGEALGMASASLELGATSDDRMLAGTARGWTNTQLAWPLIVMARTGIANPLLVLHEIDKAGGSARTGRPHSTLLAMTETVSSRNYHDQCLLADCDLSQVNWIACANAIEPIPAALRSRFRIVDLPQPEPEQFEAVLRSITAETARGWEVPPTMLPDLPERAASMLRERFARDRSIRSLARDARALLGAALADQRPQRH